jgi:hypothetical protein
MITLHPLLFATALVVLASADDRELIVTWPDGSEVRACAKAPLRGMPDPCAVAREGRWKPERDAFHPNGYPPIENAEVRCVPHPGCFEDRSNYIDGYNQPRGRR